MNTHLYGGSKGGGRMDQPIINGQKSSKKDDWWNGEIVQKLINITRSQER